MIISGGILQGVWPIKYQKKCWSCDFRCQSKSGITQIFNTSITVYTSHLSVRTLCYQWLITVWYKLWYNLQNLLELRWVVFQLERYEEIQDFSRNCFAKIYNTISIVMGVAKWEQDMGLCKLQAWVLSWQCCINIWMKIHYHLPKEFPWNLARTVGVM